MYQNFCNLDLLKDTEKVGVVNLSLETLAITGSLERYLKLWICGQKLFLHGTLVCEPYCVARIDSA